MPGAGEAVAGGRRAETAMLDVLGWNLGVGAWGLETLVIWSVLLGFRSRSWARSRPAASGCGGAAALVGGWLGSDWLGGATDWGPLVDGLRLGPWLIGAVGLAIAVDFVLRRRTGGTYARDSRAIE